LQRVQQNPRKGTEQTVQWWKRERDMAEILEFLQGEVRYVNRLIRDKARDFESFAREDVVEQTSGFDYFREAEVSEDLMSQLQTYFASLF